MFNIFCLGFLLFQNFNFVVLGDRTANAKTEVFELIIDEIKILNPDFLINVGDLIEGYTDDANTIESEWDYIIRQLNRTGVPYYLTPGNHDIWDAKSESIYCKHFGKTYYSFDYEKCHFVIIDNSRYDSLSALPAKELNWLKQDLAKHKKARLTFCFMHKPFWYNSNQAIALHKFFQAGGVDYVFSGHNHYYMSKIWDSIVYIQVGPSGSRFKVHQDEEQGAFQNYLLVKVKDNSVNIAVLKPGNVKPFDIVTSEAISLIDRIENEAVQISKIIIPENQVTLDTIGLKISNVTQLPIKTTLKWNLRNQNWVILPESVNCLLETKASGYYQFQCQLKEPENIYPLPELIFTYPFAVNKTHSVKKLLPIHRTAICQKLARSPIIDGILNDSGWQRVKPITIFGTSEGNLSPIEKTLVYFAYDENNLFLGVSCIESKIAKLRTKITRHDEAVYQDDHLNLILQPDLATQGYYQIFINPIGTIADRFCRLESGGSTKDPTWNILAQIKTFCNEKSWGVEMAIPFNQFQNYSKTDWRFNIVRYQYRLDKVGIYQVPFVHDPKTFATLKFCH